MYICVYVYTYVCMWTYPMVTGTVGISLCSQRFTNNFSPFSRSTYYTYIHTYIDSGITYIHV